MTITSKPLGPISEELLQNLLRALTPIGLNEDSTSYHIGYRCAQDNFRAVLLHRLNIPELPAVQPVPETKLRRIPQRSAWNPLGW